MTTITKAVPKKRRAVKKPAEAEQAVIQVRIDAKTKDKAVRLFKRDVRRAHAAGECTQEELSY